jgi:hypothetical protein
MTSRAIWMLALAAVAMVGCPRAETPNPPEKPAANKQAEPQKPKRPDGVVGYYVLDDPAHYMAQEMKGVPPGQVMHLGIEEGRWMMRDMLTGYGGTWAEDKGDATLTVNEGPTGKASGKERITATRTNSGVKLSLKGSTGHATRFTYVGLVAPKEFGYDEFLGPKK